MKVIQQEGIIYYPDLGVFFLDPKYWYDYYRRHGILPKPPSRKDKFLDKLFDFGMGELTDWLFGGDSSGGLFSKILDLPSKIVDLPSKLFDLPQKATEGFSKIIDPIASIFGGGGASNFASQVKDLPLEVLQGITGKFDVGDKAALIDEILGSAPMSKATGTTAQSGLFSSLSKPLAAIGTFLDAYQRGKPSAWGLGGAALAGLSNPATLPFAVIGMGLGSILGKRKKRRQERKMAREMAAHLAPELGISDIEGLSETIRRNLNFFQDKNFNLPEWSARMKSRLSGIGEDPLRLIALEGELLGADKMKGELKKMLDYENWLRNRLKFANLNVLEMPRHLEISRLTNPFYKHKGSLDSLRGYAGQDPFLNELKALLQ